MTVEKTFSDGGKAYLNFEGSGDGKLTVTADPNEGIDRSLVITIVTADGSVSEERTVFQSGLREVFAAADGDFLAADGETYNVLKNV